MIQLILTLFAAMMGGALASFLNVVVWRLPNHLSLVKPNSFCPKCKHPIRFYDNVPILGWLFLRGKCRDCKEPISVRYPIIESIGFILTGSIFYAILFAGWTPSESSILYWDEMKNFLFPSGETISYSFFPKETDFLYETGIFLVVLWTTFFFLLLAEGLIEWDSFAIPKSLKLFAWGLGIAALATHYFLLSNHSVGVQWFGLFVSVMITGLFLSTEKRKTFIFPAILTGLFCGYDFTVLVGCFKVAVFLPILLTGPIAFVIHKIGGRHCDLLILFCLNMVFAATK